MSPVLTYIYMSNHQVCNYPASVLYSNKVVYTSFVSSTETVTIETRVFLFSVVPHLLPQKQKSFLSSIQALTLLLAYKQEHHSDPLFRLLPTCYHRNKHQAVTHLLRSSKSCLSYIYQLKILHLLLKFLLLLSKFYFVRGEFKILR